MTTPTGCQRSPMLHVYSMGAFVATINRQHRGADNFNAAEPWLLLHNTGRIDRFASQREARDEAQKAWPRVELRRS